MLSLLASTAADAPIYWADLGLKPGIDLGFFTLRFYSLAYIAGIAFGFWHLSKMIRSPGAPLAQRHAEDLFFYCTLGIILGGRLGYATFYRPDLWLNPLEMLKLWEGGMSFHGGVLGVLVAIAWICRRNGLPFLRVSDYIAVNAPVGMFLGRLANFNNGELWGRQTDVAWGMVFPHGGNIVRHPSQLYEAVLEGALLAVILLWMFWKTDARFRPGLLVGVFTAGIAAGRFIVEFYREPDAHLMEFAARTGLSMGQWLTIPLILIGIALIIRALQKPPLATAPPQTV